ncbi:MAG: hypothetical protein QOJ57_2615 [Thermoleophilaceae bacterium]|nr:hypothetical protein [Thermoleophilaceae bacterium]
MGRNIRDSGNPTRATARLPVETVLAQRITIEFDEFGWQSLSAEATRQGVTLEELLVHAAMYYLADLDSGRVAARVFRSVVDEEEKPPEETGERRFKRRDETDE